LLTAVAPMFGGRLSLLFVDYMTRFFQLPYPTVGYITKPQTQGSSSLPLIPSLTSFPTPAFPLSYSYSAMSQLNGAYYVFTLEFGKQPLV